MSVGIYLREARQAAGYSLEQISAQTRIRVAVLRDLENDQFESAGGNAYARGHIRTIGQLLGADIDLLLTKFQATTGQIDRPMIDLLTESSATSLHRQKHLPKFSYKFLATSAAVLVGLMILVPTASSIIKSTTKSAQKVSIAAKSVAVPATQAGITSKRKQQSATTPVVTTGNLVLSADSGTTWIAVTDANGNNVFTGKLVRGQTQNFDASQLLDITLGNAGAVNITLDGKFLGAAGTQGEVKYLQFGPGATSNTTITQG